MLHPGRPIAPHDLALAWSFELWAVVPLALIAIAAARGFALSSRPDLKAAFATGWLLICAALLSPLHAAGSALLSAHMIQHELLMVGATPLIALSRPIGPLLNGMPSSARRRAGSVARRLQLDPLAAAALHGLAIWIWHVPRLYDATQTSDVVHALQHVSFIATALLLWQAVLKRSQLGRGVAALFVTLLHTTILGALLTFSDRLWYNSYANTTAAWGFTGVEDQQLAGLIMWMPGGIAYVIAGLHLIHTWLKQQDSRMLPLGVVRQ
jgi:putative membrane protein